MRFSIFTPTNNTKYLKETYQSLLNQTYDDWEWIIVPNGGVKIPQWLKEAKNTRIIRHKSDKVGELKKFACSQANGEYLVELDHDDMLTPDCLEKVSKVDADFIYSNCFQINNEWVSQLWNPDMGWKTREHEYDGHKILEQISPEPTPSNMSRIWFAPNHVRVWRKEFYDRIGGHNPDMKISDDHELCCRTYLEGTIVHIDEPLYVYRIHGENSWLKYQDDIDVTMWDNHDKYFIPMQEQWTREQGLRLIDLGGAIGCPVGYESYDRHNADIVGDLQDIWNLEDNSVGLLRAHDIIEHLKDPIHTMNEAYRVLAHGGVFDVLVPSTNGVGAWCDPTHISFWNIRSFRYYTEPDMRQFIEPEAQCKFQVVKLVDKLMWDNIPYVEAHLLAIKDDYRYYGQLYW